MELTPEQAKEIVEDQGRQATGRAWVNLDWVVVEVTNEPNVWVNRSNCIVEFAPQDDLETMVEVAV